MAALRSSSRLISRLAGSTISKSTHANRPISRALRPFLLLPQQSRNLHITSYLLRQDPNIAPGEPKKGESLPSGIPPSTIYAFEDIQAISSSPDSYPHHILIDVREPGELLQTGRIPSAKNIPIKTAPDAFFMNAEDFEDKYGFPRPGDEEEVIFYCKAGVRSKAAARLAGQAGFGGKYGEYPGSFDEWAQKGGQVQKE